MTDTIEEITQEAICLGPTGIHRELIFSFLCDLVRKSEVPTQTIVMKRVMEMTLAKKQNKGHIFENRTGATVNYILPDDEENEALNEIDGNIAGVDWEA